MQHRSSSPTKGKRPSRNNTTTTDNESDHSQRTSKPSSKLPMSSSSSPSSSQNLTRVFAAAALYVLSGSTQPLLMTLVKQSGLGDPTCQLYMLFYYLGPALVSLRFCIPSSFRRTTDEPTTKRPSRNAVLRSASIASIDIVAQAMNYTGSTFCGPTIFAIIYSSVTIWTALFSRLLLHRTLTGIQWMGVCVVFCGLCITAWDSAALGPEVWKGAVLVFVGSTVHAMTYVLSEAIMTKNTTNENASTDNHNNNEHDSSNDDNEQLGVTENCAVQGIVACLVYLTWQCIYTLPRFQERILQPAQQSGTSLTRALLILGGIGGSNLVHALAFFYTLKCVPGGATSAGVMKGLQAVLVFVVTSVVYCDRSSEDGMGEMCFTKIKFISLVVVVGGVLLFAIGTDAGRKRSVGNDGKSL